MTTYNIYDSKFDMAVAYDLTIDQVNDIMHYAEEVLLDARINWVVIDEPDYHFVVTDGEE